MTEDNSSSRETIIKYMCKILDITYISGGNHAEYILNKLEKCYSYLINNNDLRQGNTYNVIFRYKRY